MKQWWIGDARFYKQAWEEAIDDLREEVAKRKQAEDVMALNASQALRVKVLEGELRIARAEVQRARLAVERKSEMALFWQGRGEELEQVCDDMAKVLKKHGLEVPRVEDGSEAASEPLKRGRYAS